MVVKNLVRDDINEADSNAIRMTQNARLCNRSKYKVSVNIARVSKPQKKKKHLNKKVSVN